VYHICEVKATTRYGKGAQQMYNKYEELLKQTGKTSYQVSKDTGIGENTLSQWKTGRSKPKVDKLMILAKYFNVPVTYFLKERG
jgi:repressor LexA